MPLKKAIDAKDIILLQVLAINARIRNTELARLTSLSEGAVRARIEWLESNQFIVGYRADIQHGILQRDPLAWVECTVGSSSSGAIERFENGLAALPGVLSFDRRSHASYILKIAHRAPDEALRALALCAGVEFRELKIQSIESEIATRGPERRNSLALETAAAESSGASKGNTAPNRLRTS